MHILIAPNAFKNSLTAGDAAAAILKGLEQSSLTFTHTLFPIGDGGNGTAALIVDNRRGRRLSGEVRDPLGRAIRADFGLIDDGRTAVIEMADASGLQFLTQAELDPLLASSAGTGDLMKLALDAGVRNIILCMGGSATVDGGAGILRALGIRFLDGGGQEIPDRPELMNSVAGIDITGMDNRMSGCAVSILCDVDNPLLGSAGAAAMFGPQKGASAESVKKLEAGLSCLRDVIWRQLGKEMDLPFGGTAGGAAAGLYALIGARLERGIDYFLETTGFEKALAKATLLITGEGSIDEQTLQGKGPFGVASRAKRRGLPVIALAGKVPLQNNESLNAYFDVLLAIGHEPASLGEAMRDAGENITRTARTVGQMLCVSGHEKVS